MPALSIDEFLASIRSCTSAEQLFSAYRAEAEASGFPNVIFSRLTALSEDRSQIADAIEIPYLHIPEGAAASYLGENLGEHDPLFDVLPFTHAPFSWSDLPRMIDLTPQAIEVIECCRDLGMHNEVTIPFHGPRQKCDFFTLSQRDSNSCDPAEISVMASKSYATWQRFSALEAVGRCSTLNSSLGSILSSTSRAHEGAPGELPATAPHRDGSANITHDECQALTFAEVAYKRFRAGLTDLDDHLLDLIGLEMYNRLKRRGLIYDEADDKRWRYVARPSPVALSHLRTCGHVARIRDQIWQLYVRPDERPAEWL